MARKKFIKEIKGIDALFSDENEDVKVDPSNKRDEKSGLKSNLVKTSYNMDADLYEKLKACSYKERLTASKLIESCIKDYFLKIGEEEVDQALKMYRSAKQK